MLIKGPWARLESSFCTLLGDVMRQERNFACSVEKEREEIPMNHKGGERGVSLLFVMSLNNLRQSV
jgi:hypothetical protein